MAKAKAKTKKPTTKEAKIEIMKNGPYLVFGSLPLDKAIIKADEENTSIKWLKGTEYPKRENYALCRCGQSTNRPYCTGTHARIGFVGTETASMKKYTALAKKTKGPRLNLTDAESLCSRTRFCDRSNGTWEFTKDSANPKSKKLAIQTACNCPSGRLVIWDKKTKKPIEPRFKKSISVIEDVPARVSGPIWAKGGILLISSDGTLYEVRNRMSLCRCGKSGNKPFCDGTHIDIEFDDGDKTLGSKK